MAKARENNIIPNIHIARLPICKFPSLYELYRIAIIYINNSRYVCDMFDTRSKTYTLGGWSYAIVI